MEKGRAAMSNDIAIVQFYMGGIINPPTQKQLKQMFPNVQYVQAFPVDVPSPASEPEAMTLSKRQLQNTRSYARKLKKSARRSFAKDLEEAMSNHPVAAKTIVAYMNDRKMEKFDDTSELPFVSEQQEECGDIDIAVQPVQPFGKKVVA